MKPPRSASGFTLVELLVVIAIVLTLAALATPVTLRVIDSNRLSGSADMLGNKLTQYQQEAVTANEPIEVRIYRFKDRNDVTDTAYYRGIQFYHDAPSSSNSSQIVPTALDRAYIFERGTCISPNSALSTILSLSSQTPASGGDSFPDAYTDVSYVSFKFLPDGSTDLNPTSGGLWFLTVISDKDVARSEVGTSDSQIHDYITVQVDPYTGRVRTFRP